MIKTSSSIAASLLAVMALASRAAQAHPAELQAAQSAIRTLLNGGAAPAGVTVPAFSAGQKARDFTLKDIHGKSRSLSDYKGKYVLLDFSATWCGPCNNAVPKLNEYHGKYKDKGLVILAVYSEDAGTVRRHAAAKGMKYITLVDGGPAAYAYRVRAYPTFLLVDEKGNIVDGTEGHSLDKAINAFKKAKGLK